MKYAWIALVFLLGCCTGCKPKVMLFTAAPRIVTSKDTVQLRWKTRGKAAMSFSRQRVARPPTDSVDLLDFVLVAAKWGKTSAPFLQQVQLVAEESQDPLSMPITGLEGDTLIAAGIKDTLLYRGFEMVSVMSLSHRPIVAVHDGVTTLLPDSGIIVTTLQGLPYSGPWILKSALTPIEKTDRSKIPNTFDARTIIKLIKH